MLKIARGTLVKFAVTSPTQRHEIPFLVRSPAGSSQQMMNIQVLARSTLLAPPAVPFQHERTDHFVSGFGPSGHHAVSILVSNLGLVMLRRNSIWRSLGRSSYVRRNAAMTIAQSPSC